MHTEIHSTDDLYARLVGGAPLRGLVVQGLDLRGLTDLLLAAPAEGCVFLGCDLDGRAASHIQATGGLLFPRLPGLPYHPFRPDLYTVEELMAGYRRGAPESFFADTLDSRIYAHYSRYRQPDVEIPILEALAQRLHDHAIDDALQDLLAEGWLVVGVMGGHRVRRDDPVYAEVARLGWRLARAEYLVATGGGPGGMEAANLGAWMSRFELADLEEAVAVLAAAPTYQDPGWFDAAYAVRERWPNGGNSLAVPTWFYGHEPSNLFSAFIAKYFANSLREDGLLALATHGVIYAPGSAGTIQEIFMDATQNHYGTFHLVSPMVLLGSRYWTEDMPVLPLLRHLARGSQYERFIGVCDTAEAAVEFLKANPPAMYAGSGDPAKTI